MKKIDKFKKDKGDAIFITILVSLILILGVAGLVLDLGKNVVFRTNYTSIAQTASQSAVKKINAKGSLTAESYSEFITDYYSKAHGVPHNKTKFFTNGCKITVPGVNNSKPFEYTSPYFKIALSGNRGDSISKDPFKASNKTYIHGTGKEIMSQISNLKTTLQGNNTVYRVFNVEVFEAIPNFMLGMMGMDCQQLNINVSSVAFGSQEDLK